MNTEDSSLPVVTMSYTLHNRSKRSVDCEVFGWLENSVCLGREDAEGTRRNELMRGSNFSALNCSAIPSKSTISGVSTRPDVLFENFESESYGEWTVEGDAFGKGPVALKDLPSYQSISGAKGERVVNSHASSSGDDVASRDSKTGRFISPEFDVSRRFLNVSVSGGAREKRSCVNLLIYKDVIDPISGQPSGQKKWTTVDSVTGENSGQLVWKTLNMSAFQGEKAKLEILDAHKGGWGHIGVDQLILSDTPKVEKDLEKLNDYGTMSLAVLSGADSQFIGSPSESSPFESDKTPQKSASATLTEGLVGSLGQRITLEPGESKQVVFVLTWHFPNLTVRDSLRDMDG